MKKLPLKTKLLLAGDILLLPIMFLCKLLTDWMLATESPCPWVRFGGKCVTCGGTHFVNTLCSGDLVAAFHWNQFLFVITALLAVSYVLLHLYWLKEAQWARKILVKVYSIPGLIIAGVYMIVFLLARNVVPITRIAEHFFG